jgi:hypothetical protein
VTFGKSALLIGIGVRSPRIPPELPSSGSYPAAPATIE